MPRMAYICKHGSDRWRAQVYKHGVRTSKIHPTREAAEEWANLMEMSVPDKRELMKLEATDDSPALVAPIPRVVLSAIRAAPVQPMHIVMATVPCRRASGVYFLFVDGEVVYVGQSVDMLGRISRHRREGKKFDAFGMIECEKKDMDELERVYIRAFVPEWNLTMGGRQATEGASA